MSVFRRFFSGMIIVMIILVSVSPVLVLAKERTVNESFNSEDKKESNIDKEIEEKDKVTPAVFKEEDSGVSIVGSVIKTIFILALLIIMIYFVLKLINRNKTLQKHRVLENLGGITVGTNKSIQIIRIGDHFYLIGVGDTVQMLEEITDEQVIEDLLTEETAQAPVLFNQVLQKAKQFVGKKESKESDSDDFKSLFQQELEELNSSRKSLRNAHGERDKRDE